MKSIDSFQAASPHTQMSGVVRVTTGPPRGVSQALLRTVPASSPLGFSDPLHSRFRSSRQECLLDCEGLGRLTSVARSLGSGCSLLRRTALRARSLRPSGRRTRRGQTAPNLGLGTVWGADQRPVVCVTASCCGCQPAYPECGSTAREVSGESGPTSGVLCGDLSCGTWGP